MTLHQAATVLATLARTERFDLKAMGTNYVWRDQTGEVKGSGFSGRHFRTVTVHETVGDLTKFHLFEGNCADILLLVSSSEVQLLTTPT